MQKEAKTNEPLYYSRNLAKQLNQGKQKGYSEIIEAKKTRYTARMFSSQGLANISQ